MTRIRIFCLSFLLIACTHTSLHAQKNISPTDSLRIVGAIMNPTTFTLSDLESFAQSKIEDQIIYNHKGEIRDTLTNMSGIPIKTLLQSIHYNYNQPRELNEFYFIFTASDGYKVVFSWNEIYNTDLGNHYFIVTELKGKKLKDLKQRIVFISDADIKTGRRYIKGLQKIEVFRIN